MSHLPVSTGCIDGKKPAAAKRLPLVGGSVQLFFDFAPECSNSPASTEMSKAGRLVRTAERALPYFCMDALEEISRQDGNPVLFQLVKTRGQQLKDEAMLRAAEITQ